jgi:hypothetical protein
MTSVAEHHDAGVVRHGPPPPPRGWRRLLYPGMLRAAWMVPLFFGIGSGIVVLCRWWASGIRSGSARSSSSSALTAAPIGLEFLTE